MKKQKNTYHLTHVYPHQDSKATQIAYQDRARFAEHPDAGEFFRDYIPGEFDGMVLPNGTDLSTITHVLVKRLNAYQQARILLTQEQFEKMISKVVHRVVAMEEM